MTHTKQKVGPTSNKAATSVLCGRRVDRYLQQDPLVRPVWQQGLQAAGSVVRMSWCYRHETVMHAQHLQPLFHVPSISTHKHAVQCSAADLCLCNAALPSLYGPLSAHLLLLLPLPAFPCRQAGVCGPQAGPQVRHGGTGAQHARRLGQGSSWQGLVCVDEAERGSQCRQLSSGCL